MCRSKSGRCQRVIARILSFEDLRTLPWAEQAQPLRCRLRTHHPTKTPAKIFAKPSLAEDVFDLLDDPASSNIAPAVKTSLGGTSSG